MLAVKWLIWFRIEDKTLLFGAELRLIYLGYNELIYLGFTNSWQLENHRKTSMSTYNILDNDKSEHFFQVIYKWIPKNKEGIYYYVTSMLALQFLKQKLFNNHIGSNTLFEITCTSK